MNKKENPLYLHAERELKLAGLDKPEADYGGALYKAVLDLVETFCGEGHSGMSAEMTLAIFDRVARWKTLSPITNNPQVLVSLGNLEVLTCNESFLGFPAVTQAR